MATLVSNRTHVAIASNWWGAGATVDEAIKRLAKEVRRWGSMAPTDVACSIYSHGPDEYLSWQNERVFLVDRETSLVKAYAIADHGVRGMDPNRPLSTMRLSGPAGAYWKGEEAIEIIAGWNTAGRAPIGEKDPLLL